MMKRMLRVSICLGVLLVGNLAMRASTGPEEVLTSAAAAYDAGDWNTAIDQYEDLLKAGYESAALHYNLGNAYFKAEELGPSILHYRRGLRLRPGDSDLRHNLKLAAEATRNDLIPLPPFFLTRAWSRFYQLFPRNGWRILWLVFLYAGVACGLVWLLGKKGQWRRRAFNAGLLMGALTVLCFVAMLSRKNFEQDQAPAVFMVEQGSLYSAADPASPAIREVYEGLQVVVTDQIGEMVKVVLRNGEEGWLPGSSLQRVFEEE